MIKIGGYKIEDNAPCFIIAEAGVNHNGNLKLALELVDKAAGVGANAVKFQAFNANLLASTEARLAKYQENTGSNNQLEMLKKLELSESDFKKIKKHCDSQRIIFLCSAFDFESAKMLNKLDLPAYKVGSGELTNLPLLAQIARFNKPIILSTGMANLKEVRQAVKTIQDAGNKEIILLHCTTNYPTEYRDVNLKAILTIKHEFNLPVGFSDHTQGGTVAIAAVALGARVIEKHFTLDKNLPGPDHAVSIEPKELAEMVQSIRNIELSFGSDVKKPTHSELAIKKLVRKSIFANCDIKKGKRIEELMLAIKRPEIGLRPEFVTQIVGKVSVVNIKKDQPIFLGDLK